MKKSILLLIVLTINSTNISQAAFGRIAAEKELRTATEKKLAHEQSTNTKLLAATSILGVGCMAMLLVGAAIGAKGRKASHGTQE